MSKDNGGSAFPHTEVFVDGSSGSLIYENYRGLTMRDYFAANAMQGMLASLVGTTSWLSGPEIAKCAFVYADTMIAERDK